MHRVGAVGAGPVAVAGGIVEGFRQVIAGGVGLGQLEKTCGAGIQGIDIRAGSGVIIEAAIVTIEAAGNRAGQRIILVRVSGEVRIGDGHAGRLARDKAVERQGAGGVKGRGGVVGAHQVDGDFPRGGSGRGRARTVVGCDREGFRGDFARAQGVAGQGIAVGAVRIEGQRSVQARHLSRGGVFLRHLPAFTAFSVAHGKDKGIAILVVGREAAFGLLSILVFPHGKHGVDAELRGVVGAGDGNADGHVNVLAVGVRGLDVEGVRGGFPFLQALHGRVVVVEVIDVLAADRIDIERAVLPLGHNARAVEVAVARHDLVAEVVQPLVIAEQLAEAVGPLGKAVFGHVLAGGRAGEDFRPVVGAFDANGNFFLRGRAVLVRHHYGEGIMQGVPCGNMPAVCDRIGVGTIRIEGYRTVSGIDCSVAVRIALQAVGHAVARIHIRGFDGARMAEILDGCGGRHLLQGEAVGLGNDRAVVGALDGDGDGHVLRHAVEHDRKFLGEGIACVEGLDGVAGVVQSINILARGRVDGNVTVLALQALHLAAASPLNAEFRIAGRGAVGFLGLQLARRRD